jgi:hypothetical protein
MTHGHGSRGMVGKERPAVVPNVPDPAGLEDSGDLFAGDGRVGGDGPS